jgi:hypothetical protein
MKLELFEEGNNTIHEYQKSQVVRLYDVFLLAPFLMYVGYKAKGIKEWERYGIYAIAIGTLVYNARNYIKNKKSQQRAKST